MQISAQTSARCRMNKISNLAAICVCLSLLVGVVSYFVKADSSIPFPESFLEEYIEYINATNSRPQNWTLQPCAEMLMVVAIYANDH
jgi:hypothetical protein